jgi:hypothetical protein
MIKRHPQHYRNYQIVGNIGSDGKINHYTVKSTINADIEKFKHIKFSDIESAKCFISLLFSVLY